MVERKRVVESGEEDEVEDEVRGGERRGEKWRRKRKGRRDYRPMKGRGTGFGVSGGNAPWWKREGGSFALMRGRMGMGMGWDENGHVPSRTAHSKRYIPTLPSTQTLTVQYNPTLTPSLHPHR